jgi:hypothetical protein
MCLPSIEKIESWRPKALKAGISVSQFVMDRVEDLLRKERRRRRRLPEED